MRASRLTHTLVFDGTCRICRPLARLLVRWDRPGRLSVRPSTADVRRAFPQISPDAFDDAIQLIGPDGRVWSGARAIEALLPLLPWGRPLGWAFRLPGARTIADRMYRLVARHRRRLGCGDSCALAPGDGATPHGLVTGPHGPARRGPEHTRP